MCEIRCDATPGRPREGVKLPDRREGGSTKMTGDDSHDRVGGEDRRYTEEEEEVADAGGSMARNLSRYNSAARTGDRDDEDDRRRN